MQFKPSAAGVYTFTVTAKNADDCTASAIEIITVIDIRAGQKGNLLTVCHEGQPIAVDRKSVQAHLAHGDQLGSCATEATANARMANPAETILAVYPNPAGSETHIRFRLSEGEQYKLAIHDVRGALVKTIASGTAAQEGNFTYSFTAADMAMGIYIIKLATDSKVTTVRMVVQH